MQAQDCQYSVDEVLYGAGHNTIQLHRVNPTQYPVKQKVTRMGSFPNA
jgi:hypothetical protein